VVGGNSHCCPYRHDHYDVRVKKAPAGILPVVAVDRAAGRPLHRQLYEGYREAIVSGRLRPGERLPSTRGLAAELAISRIPALGAFEQLLAEGYVESGVGAGTFVARSLPDPPPLDAHTRPPRPRPGRRPVSRAMASLPGREPEPWMQGSGPFRTSESAADFFPFPAWADIVARHCRNPGRSQLRYGDPMGHEPFREQIAAYLRTARGVRCEAGQVMVVSGSQQALQIAARVLLEPRCAVWVEEPGYPGARDVLAMAGARLEPVPVDAEGLEVGAGIARGRRARAVYVTPSHQYPLGVTMSASRRLQLLDWARRRGAWILEDDYDSEYRYDSQPIAALQGLDRDDRVVYVGTFSKVLFPALRIGYLVIPPDLVPRFAAVREALDIFPPTLFQAALADFVAEGHFARHLRRTRQLYRERRGVLAECLRDELGGVLDVVGEQAGLHVVARLRGRTSDRRIALRAARRGLWTMPLSGCYLGPATSQGLVLGYGGSSAAAIPAAVRQLRDVLESRS
jgi:GntR family transcriptional regulator/MocR family aminotransferase